MMCCINNWLTLQCSSPHFGKDAKLCPKGNVIDFICGRTSRQRSNRELVEGKDAPHVKLGVVARLRKEVGLVRDNKSMAKMVADFGKVTNKSSGRTITKVCLIPR